MRFNYTKCEYCVSLAAIKRIVGLSVFVQHLLNLTTPLDLLWPWTHLVNCLVMLPDPNVLVCWSYMLLLHPLSMPDKPSHVSWSSAHLCD